MKLSMNMTTALMVITSTLLMLTTAVAVVNFTASEAHANRLECADGTPVPEPVPYPGYSSDFCAEEDRGGVHVPTGTEMGTASDLGLPLVNVSEDSPLIANILTVLFTIAGALATIFIIVGGFKYVVSAGNPDQVQKAKNTILYAVVGLVVSIFAGVIVNFVVTNL